MNWLSHFEEAIRTMSVGEAIFVGALMICWAMPSRPPTPSFNVIEGYLREIRDALRQLADRK